MQLPELPRAITCEIKDIEDYMDVPGLIQRIHEFSDSTIHINKNMENVSVEFTTYNIHNVFDLTMVADKMLEIESEFTVEISLLHMSPYNELPN